ncbi:ac transposable element-derived 4 [Fusarium phyllophilum]|uniref:Ac transposable element-derived 4 n=1 Tax=Fusarium phyllophilum TaxID=47803 RepID=A0A8H5ISR6_9HYPO|nr:ac transposable element-derived 4 [Fusarium phyllophilum]
MICLGIHREISIKDHWKAPSLGDQRPLHSFTKFMPLLKFELITRYFRTFDYTKLDVRDESDLPKTFQAAEEWSEHIQKASAELYLPGTDLTVDECMIPFTGRSKETTVVKNKPTLVGFKVWVIAQQGYFLQWLWHVKASPYKAVIVELPIPKPYGKQGKLQTEIPLSNTQSVVVHLLKRLPIQTYHVFTDNLFSSPHLFRRLRQLGYGATGTARPNCGITTEMKHIKETGKAPDGRPLEYNEVIQIAWKDSNIVLFLSTVHSGAPHERTPKKRKLPAKRGTKAEARRLQQVFNGDSFKMIPIPTVAAAYNDEMNHVDRGDQIRSYTTFAHNSLIGSLI